MSLKEMRGNLYKYESIPLYITYHPAALLRNPSLKLSAWEDFKFIKKFLKDNIQVKLILEEKKINTQPHSDEAEKGTIRGDFGVGTMKNICHASDSVESAETELDRFFNQNELFEY